MSGLGTAKVAGLFARRKPTAANFSTFCAFLLPVDLLTEPFQPVTASCLRPYRLFQPARHGVDAHVDLEAQNQGHAHEVEPDHEAHQGPNGAVEVVVRVENLDVENKQ